MPPHVVDALAVVGLVVVAVSIVSIPFLAVHVAKPGAGLDSPAGLAFLGSVAAVALFVASLLSPA